MGIVALGPETEPARLARALEAADDEAFASVLDVFLATHYPLRLGAPLRCEECGARNDVDAPYEREFAPSDPPLGAHPAEDTPASYPTDDELSALAEAHFRERARRFPEDSVDLVLTDETPAVDDGGEPLMGSYVPGSVGDAHGVPERPTVTLYLRTFRAMWDDDGPYDVAGEVRETVEHELTHHEHWLTGDDPMDDEERALIAEEARRLHGKKQLARGAARGLGADVLEFLRRTWLIWALILLAVAVTLAAGPGLGAVE
jgi:hypothetical protein